MGWNREKVQQRIKDRDFNSNEVEITKHSREMDFSNLGTKEVREVDGSHVYLNIKNIDALIEDAGNNKDNQRKLIRALNTLLRAQNAIFKEQHIIQVQSAKLHLINYKPYEEQDKICLGSVVASISYISFIHDIFNDVFSDLNKFQCNGGSSFGKFYVANIGKRADRELISLGSSANWGAKILDASGNLTVTEETYFLLPEDLKKIFFKEKVKNREVYSSTISRWSDYPDLQKKYATDYDPESLKALIEDYKASLPLSEIDITGTNQQIDFKDLSARNVKRFHSVTLFCDLDGFTNYVGEAEKEDTLKELIRLFHGIRYELQNVIEDFGGTAVQHRGDCVIATFNLPIDDDKKDEKIENVVQAAAGLLWSMGELNKYFKGYPNLKLAIGIDGGTIVATKLGTNGDKDKILIGGSVTNAELLQQENTAGTEITITKSQFDVLKNQTLKKHFKEMSTGAYKAKDLAAKLDEDEKEASQQGRRTADIIKDQVVVQSVSNRITAKPHVNSPAYYAGDKSVF